MSFFEELQGTLFDIITNSFGYTATWTPTEGGVTQSATVLYKDDGFGNFTMEYKENDFKDLKASVSRGFEELVRIKVKEDVTLQFLVRKLETKYGGKTILAILNPPEVHGA